MTIEHRNDPDFFKKAPMYKTAVLVRSGEYVQLLSVVDSDTETGVYFKARIGGHTSFVNDSELSNFVL